MLLAVAPTSVSERLSHFTGGEWALLGAALLLGGVLLLAGWRVYRLTAIAGGASLGAVLGFFGVTLSGLLEAGLSGQAQLTYGLLGAGVGAFLGGVLALPLERWLIFLIGGSLGVLACRVAMLYWGGGIEWWVRIVAWLATGVLFGLFGWLSLGFRQLLVVLASSAWGAALLVAIPTAILVDDSWLPDPNLPTEQLLDRLRLVPEVLPTAPAVTVTWLTLTVIGVVWQLGYAEADSSSAAKPS